MSWEWSHSPEAYDNVRHNIHAQSREWLEVVYAEWRSVYNGSNLADDLYAKAMQDAKGMTEYQLAGTIWPLVENQASCENGGYMAHCCPFQCLCHTVPFDREGGDSDE